MTENKIGNVPLRFASCADGTLSVDEDVLQHVLFHHNYGDIKAYVISIVGPLRSGKSFLMTLLVRYLKQMATNSEFGNKTVSLSGFEWKSGSVGVTKGMWIWPEVFLLDTGSGEKVGIVLVDTQGVFDKNSSKMEDALLFSVTALTSSVLIYNVRNGIDEKALEHLVEFLMCMCDEFMPSSTTLEKCLFLIRDWPFVDEHAAGIDGGKMYLEKTLQDYNGSNADACYVRKYIESMFQNIACFLMSHPGMKASRKEFDGNFEDLEDAFVGDIQSLARYLFVQEDAHSGRQTCQELFQLYTSFSGKRVTNVRDFVTLTVDLKLADISTSARHLYVSGFEPSVEVSVEMIVKEHEENYKNVMAYFDGQVVKLKVDTLDRADLFRNNLHKDVIDVFFEKWLMVTKEKYTKMLEEQNRNLIDVMNINDDIANSMKNVSLVGETHQFEKAYSQLVQGLKPLLGSKLENALKVQYETRLHAASANVGSSVTMEDFLRTHRDILEEGQEILRNLSTCWLQEDMFSRWTKGVVDVFFDKWLMVAKEKYTKMLEGQMHSFIDLMKIKDDIENSMKIAFNVGEPHQYEKAYSQLVQELKPLLVCKLENALEAEYETRLHTASANVGPSVTMEEFLHTHNTILQEGQLKLRNLPPCWSDEELYSRWTKKISRVYCKTAQDVTLWKCLSVVSQTTDLDSLPRSLVNICEMKNQFLVDVCYKCEESERDEYRRQLEEKFEANLTEKTTNLRLQHDALLEEIKARQETEANLLAEATKFRLKQEALLEQMRAQQEREGNLLAEATKFRLQQEALQEQMRAQQEREANLLAEATKFRLQQEALQEQMRAQQIEQQNGRRRRCRHGIRRLFHW